MESPFALFALLSVLLIASLSDARPDLGEYWQSIMKDEAMPEAIQGLIDTRESVLPRPKKQTDCHTSTSTSHAHHNDKLVEENAKEEHFVEDFEPRPNISAYDDDKKLTEKDSSVKDSEPRPNISAAYHDDEKLTNKNSFVKDFEPSPNVSAYHDDSDKSFVNDFEPRPSVTNYHE